MNPTVDSSKFPCFFHDSLQSFEDLSRYLKTKGSQIFKEIDLLYKRNISFFRASVDLPQMTPNFIEVELFWNAKAKKIVSYDTKNNSIMRESTFILWLVSTLELYFQNPFFKLVKLLIFTILIFNGTFLFRKMMIGLKW